ncbi:MAG: anti-sigma factor [Candidatus Nanopelagicales bacterium]|jgi:hypothetical protein|nr:anti-sigma factor [Candidatus Nanopelagicales bacterium]
MSHCDPTTLALVALGEDIDPAEAAHLELCEQCLTEAAELSEVVTLGREAPVALAPAPPQVWAGISAELGLVGAPVGSNRGQLLTLPPARTPESAAPAAGGSREGGSQDGGTVVPMRPRRRFLGVAAVAAAAGAIVGGGLVWAAMDTAGEPAAPASQLVAQAVLDPLTEDVAQPGQAEVLDSPDGQVIRVDATALPPRDGFYEVWLIDEDVTKLLALGALPAGSVGTFTVPPGVSIEDFPVVDISLEPLDGDPAHSKQSLMRGVLEV